MNGEVCCILGICCPPENRAVALSKELSTDPSSPLYNNPELADRVAVHLFKFFDFAPAGTLTPLVSAVTTMAKAHKDKP